MTNKNTLDPLIAQLRERDDDDTIEAADALTAMSERIATIQKVRDGYASQAKFADIDCAVHFREFVRRIDTALSQGENR